MAESAEPKILSQLFLDSGGNPVDRAQDAATIEVRYRNPDGTTETTILRKQEESDRA